MRRILPNILLTVIGVVLTVLFGDRLVAAPMGSVVTYQGHLEQTVVSGGGGIGQQPASSQSPVTGICDFRFSLWDALTNGSLVGSTQTVSAVNVSNGLFTVTLDFGANAFNGDARWLEIGVRTNGGGAFTELAPRQEAPLMPYALYAAEAGSAAATNVAGLGSSAFQDTSFFDPAGAGTAAAQAATNNFGNTAAATLTNAANQIAGTLAGNGAGVTNLNSQAFTNASRLGLIEIPDPVPAANDYFGISVAGVGTNQFVIGGAYNKTIGGNYAVGQAYLYDTTGTLLATINSPAPAAGDGFGRSMAGVGTNQFVIGAYNKTIGGNSQVGQAYLYDTTGALLATITNPAPAANDLFGYSVAAVGTNQFVIGARAKTIGGISGAGQAYLYDTTGTLLATITNPTPAANDNFGFSVAAVGTNQFVIGADGKTIDTNSLVGEAYLYDTTGTLLATITNPAPAANDLFGYSVAGVGTNQFVIGASGQTIGTNTLVGQAYLYDTTGTLLATITNPAPAAGDDFGHFTAAVGTNQFVIGAYAKMIGGNATVGQAYLYDMSVSSVPGLIADGVAPNAIGLEQLNVISVDTRYVLKTGDTMTGPLNVLAVVTASSFIGNGSGLTNIPTSGVLNFLVSVTNVVTNAVIAATNGLATTNYVIAATNTFGTTVAVSLTNAANQFTGTFTNGTYYGDGGGLTNIAAIKVVTNASPPAVVAGYGYFWPSNYNLYWVTPTKTNLITAGQ